jgi:hypothetical protein
VSVSGRVAGTSRWVVLAPRAAVATLPSTPAGFAIPLAWPRRDLVVDRIRLDVEREATTSMRIDHIALYPSLHRAEARTRGP